MTWVASLTTAIFVLCLCLLVVTGIVTNCREWQAVLITRRDGEFEYRRTGIFELQLPKKNEISAERRTVLQFLLQDPYASQATGLNVSEIALPACSQRLTHNRAVTHIRHSVALVAV
jgi:hypothetical protein